MVARPWLDGGSRQLALQARDRFVNEARRALPAVDAAVQERLRQLAFEAVKAREAHDRQDALTLYSQRRQSWLDGCFNAWEQALRQERHDSGRTVEAGLELMGMDVMDNRIIASRMAAALHDRVLSEFEDLRVRIEHLEQRELSPKDIVRPEVLVLKLVDQWVESGLPRQGLQMVIESMQQRLADQLQAAYRTVNASLIAQNVLPTIQLQQRVRRTPQGDAPASSRPGMRPGTVDSAPSRPRDARDVPGPGTQAAAAGRGSRPVSALEETRLMTGTTPLARARMRAQGVLGQLKRLLVGQVADFEKTSRQPSPALADALKAASTARSDPRVAARQDAQSTTIIEDYTPAGVAQVAGTLRAQSYELKKKASTSSEKATIEIVALMFQSILAEERIPSAIRVWFARLQLPVLRVALSEPDFFGSMNHPARQLIDRIGSCVMGFDAQAINGSALETEIKRVVQVIEQYPETGGRVFQLVHDEFQKFLSKFLTAKDLTQRVVSVAQRIEQKETLAIQYTIEMRNLLTDIPVPDEIREFLFKVWAEVLALAAVRHGPQHEDTITLKQIAPELVWAASAKPNRQDRARVIQELPLLLQRLRQGMTLLGLPAAAQEAHLKIVSDTLAAAFLSKAEPIAPHRLEAMAQRLATLEDFVTDEGLGDLPLDAENIELVLGIDAAMLQVISEGGSQPSDAMVAWALELLPGHWFSLEFNGATHQVQFAWRSDRQQLFLFAASTGISYLMQRRQVAAFLQAGLLLPQEEEALSVRATRTALARLDAEPERLLN